MNILYYSYPAESWLASWNHDIVGWQPVINGLSIGVSKINMPTYLQNQECVPRARKRRWEILGSEGPPGGGI